MAAKVHFLVLGATGYLGCPALQRFIDHPNAANWTFTAIVRSADKAEKLQSIGITAVVGSLDDSQILEREASKADVVLSLADSDSLPPIQALLRGSKKRFEANGVKTVFLHISGVGVLADEAMGAYSSDLVYSDDDVTSLAALAPTQIHRNVDLALLEADEEGYIDSYLVLPGMVVGNISGKLVDLGICKGINVMFAGMIARIAVARGVGGTIGEGKNTWPVVDVEDVADLIILIYNAIPSIGHGKNGYYFAENGEATMGEFLQPIFEELVVAGKLKTATSTPLTAEELAPLGVLAPVASGNTRCRADRGRRLGWKPAKDLAALHESQRMHAKIAVSQL